MTSEPASAEPIPDVLPAIRARSFFERIDRLFRNTLFLSIMLAALMTFLVLRTLFFSPESAYERDMSDMAEQTTTALVETKDAYRPELVTTPLSVPVKAPSLPPTMPVALPKTLPGVPIKSSVPPIPISTGSSRRHTSKDSSSSRVSRLAARAAAHANGEDAIEAWRKLATGKARRAAEWRRLGISLALFGKRGALDAFHHIGDLFPIEQTKELLAARMAVKKAGGADPFGHRPVPLTAAQEMAVWNAIYGDGSIAKADVAELRHSLSLLRLGWFENIAAAQLYRKAGMQAECVIAANAATVSVSQYRSVRWAEFGAFLLGILGLLGLGFYCLVHAVQRLSDAQLRAANRAAPYASTPHPVNPYSVSPYNPGAGGFSQSAGIPNNVNYPPADQGTMPPGQSNPSDSSSPTPQYTPSGQQPYPSHLPQQYAPPSGPQSAAIPASVFKRAAELFPVHVLLLSFLVYMVAHAGIGLLAGLVLSPLRLQISRLNGTDQLRLELLLQIGLYIPIVLLTLAVFRWRTKFDPLTGERYTLRRMLTHIGFRSRNVLADIGWGAMGYAMVVPLMLLVGVISNALFSRYHTPTNPASFETLAAQMTIDKVLVLFLAAVAAPFVEEIMYRGLLYPALRKRWGIGGAAMLSGAIFSGVHPTLPGGFLVIWVIGLSLALLYEYRGSLLPGMVLHGINNALITLTGFALFAN